jgi:UDP-glucose 4-epimerase
VRVVVTGGAGFIGANLCRRLVADGHAVTALDDLSFGSADNLDGVDAQLIVGSVLDSRCVTAAVHHADAVVHLAAIGSVPRSVVDPVASHDANVTGTITVLEAARRRQAHVLFAGSSSVYGANPTLPKSESLMPRPLSPYAAGKLAAESATLAWASTYDLPVLSFRFFNVYGPLQRAGHAYAAVVPAFVDAALRHEPVTVHGDGSQTRDFTYVDTVTSVISHALARTVCHNEPVNLALGGRRSLLDLLGEIEAVAGRPVERRHVTTRVGDVPHSQADASTLRRLFPDVQATSLSDGVAATWNWMAGTHAHEVGS